MKIDKKGQQLTSTFITLAVITVILVVFGVIAVFGLNFLDDFDDDFAANSLEANASTDVKSGIGTLTGQTGNLALLVVLVIIIGALFGVLGYFISRRGG